MANIELPKDAEGREIPLDTNMLYDCNGALRKVLSYTFNPSTGRWMIEIETQINSVYRFPEGYRLTPPDSWKKLEEDLSRAIDVPKQDNFDFMTCGYFNSVGNNCQECKKKNGFDSFNCNTVAWKDILSRIRKLMGKDE